MQHSKYLTLLLSLLLLSESNPTRISTAAGDLEALCAELGKSSISLKECYGVFSQDPRSSTAHFTELAAIVVNIVTQNAEKMQSLIDTSLKNELNSTLKSILNACSKDYFDAMFILKKAKAATFFNDYANARVALLSYSHAAAMQCIDEIHYKNAVIPLVRDGSASFLNLSNIAQLTLSVVQNT